MPFLGRTLTIDLHTGRVEAAETGEALARLLLGGRGLNALHLLKNVLPGTDPLGPGNDLILSCGLLTGTAAPASSRLHVGARSPLTGLIGSSNVGAHFGAALRSLDVQSLVLRGVAAEPVVLHLSAHGARVVPAADLWGLDAWQTQSVLRERLGNDRARIMTIGPAGEAQAHIACILTERGHAAGRTGMGAVMGAKRVKAIVVEGAAGSFRPSEQARAAALAYARAIREAERYPIYSKYSNTTFVTWADEVGMLATRNYRENRFAQVEKIDGKRIIDYVVKSQSCSHCPVHCKAELRIDSGPYAGTVGERPDIEPIVALGSKCGLDDVEALLYLYNLCCKLGLDVISAASALAFAMDLTAEGIVSTAETDGIALTWGNARAMEAMLRKMAAREGFGAVLANGVAEAARIIGRGAERYAHHSKGLELTAYDPRGALGTALGYAVSNRGGDFTSVYPVPEYRWDAARGERELGLAAAVDKRSPEGKGRLVKRTMCVSAALDALGICKVPVLSVVGDFSLVAEAELASKLSGLPFAPADLLTAGERIVNLERLFNLGQGATKADDVLPAYFRRAGLPYGEAAGGTVDVAPMRAQFYAEMGWDEDGRPLPATLAALGLGELSAGA